MTKLDAVAARWHFRERPGEHLVVALEGGGQLPDHRAELAGRHQRLDALVVARDALAQVA
jgi:hypothetical protein